MLTFLLYNVKTADQHPSNLVRNIENPVRFSKNPTVIKFLIHVGGKDFPQELNSDRCFPLEI